MPTLAVAKEFNAGYAPTYLPIAIFVGGTSGVGQRMAEAFAAYTKGRAHIIIVGRNEATANSIIAGLTKPPPGADVSGWKQEFVYCDASLMANVRTTCASLAARLPRLNFLVLSAGYANLISTKETSEGLDDQLALRYYSRYVFISSLLPLLRKTRESGEDVRVMSVLGGGLGVSINLNDMGTMNSRKRWFGFAAIKVIAYSATYNDMMVMHFARHNPTIAFTHIWPGVVSTPAMQCYLGRLLSPFTYLLNLLPPYFATDPKDCAEYMLYALFDGERGAFLRNNKGDVVGSYVFDGNEGDSYDTKTRVVYGVKVHGYGGSDDGIRILVEHTEEVTRAK